MDAGNLQNASDYLNNLLLARGLLRNGKSLDFARVQACNYEPDDAPARVINLVHDLVVRRDRDADQRESLALNVRKIRDEENHKVAEIEKLKEKNEELRRSMATAEAQKRSLELSARKAEIGARELKDQMAKMKSVLDQVRAKCVNDVRKRDMELEKLKKHVTGMQRGAAQASGMKIVQLNPQPPLPRNAREFRSGVPVSDANWSLDRETNDFLSALVNETSTENVTLRHIIDVSMGSLKELTGLDETSEPLSNDPEIGIPGQYKQSRQTHSQNQTEAIVPCDQLAEQMQAVIGHCRDILKDPSFVSIEEVRIREDEIIKLREGWEKMAVRWKDAVAMIDAWRKRMMEGGNAVDLHELSILSFSKSMASMPADTDERAEEDSSTAMFDEEPSMASEIVQEVEGNFSESDSDYSHELQSPPLKRLVSSPARRGIRLPHPTARTIQAKEFSIYERDSMTSSGTDAGTGSLGGSVDSNLLHHSASSDIPLQESRHGFNRLDPDHDGRPKQKQKLSPPLSVREKLAIVEAEAKQAAAKAAENAENKNPRKRSAADRGRMKRAARRRSTLSPEELANLMGVR